MYQHIKDDHHTFQDSGGNEGSVGGKEPPISMDILHYSEQSVGT